MAWRFPYEKWWLWASISGGVGLLVLITCICCCCCRRNKKKKNKEIESVKYDRVPDEELGSEPEELTDSFDSRNSKNRKKGYLSSKRVQGRKGEPLTYYVSSPHHRAIDRVAQHNESGAESSLSDYDRASESVSISAYGDAVSTYSNDSYGTSSSFARNPGNLAIQASLIYSRDAKYVAGKIVTIDGLRFDEKEMKPMLEIKCHVVILPSKKYALKTNWYQIQKNRIKMDEYFKFKFKQLPQEAKTMLRFRLYGRRATVGRSHCLGECYVNLREIITSRGGLTLWRSITKGAPEVVDLD